MSHLINAEMYGILDQIQTHIDDLYRDILQVLHRIYQIEVDLRQLYSELKER